jgi:hypothetical protein
MHITVYVHNTLREPSAAALLTALFPRPLAVLFYSSSLILCAMNNFCFVLGTSNPPCITRDVLIKWDDVEGLQGEAGAAGMPGRVLRYRTLLP